MAECAPDQGGSVVWPSPPQQPWTQGGRLPLSRPGSGHRGSWSPFPESTVFRWNPYVATPRRVRLCWSIQCRLPQAYWAEVSVQHLPSTLVYSTSASLLWAIQKQWGRGAHNLKFRRCNTSAGLQLTTLSLSSHIHLFAPRSARFWLGWLDHVENDRQVGTQASTMFGNSTAQTHAVYLYQVWWSQMHRCSGKRIQVWTSNTLSQQSLLQQQGTWHQRLIVSTSAQKGITKTKWLEGQYVLLALLLCEKKCNICLTLCNSSVTFTVDSLPRHPVRTLGMKPRVKPDTLTLFEPAQGATLPQGTSFNKRIIVAQSKAYVFSWATQFSLLVTKRFGAQCGQVVSMQPHTSQWMQSSKHNVRQFGYLVSR